MPFEPHAAVRRYLRAVYPRLRLDISPRLRDIALELDLRAYLDVMGDLARRRVLDFGSGQGHKAIFFASLGAEVLGIDAEADQVEKCRANAARCPDLDGKVSFLLGDETALAALEAGTYDLVFSSEVIEHFPAEQARDVCGQFLRLLRPGGLLYLTTPNGAVVPPEEQEGEGHYAHHHNFTLEELSALLEGQETVCARTTGFDEDLRRNRIFYPLARLDTRLCTSRKLPAPLRAAYALASLPGLAIYNQMLYPLLARHYARVHETHADHRGGRCIFYAARRRA